MDTLRIKGLKVETIIGHHAWERKLPRTLLIDLELAIDAARAAGVDRLDDALDYDALSKAVVTFVEASRFTLIETLAERLSEKLLKEFSPGWLRLTVHKPGAVRGIEDVAVTVERGRKE